MLFEITHWGFQCCQKSEKQWFRSGHGLNHEKPSWALWTCPSILWPCYQSPTWNCFWGLVSLSWQITSETHQCEVQRSTYRGQDFLYRFSLFQKGVNSSMTSTRWAMQLLRSTWAKMICGSLRSTIIIVYKECTLCVAERMLHTILLYGWTWMSAMWPDQLLSN
jgi:hypothetical protein